MDEYVDENGRHVAVKTLRPDMSGTEKKRFIKEVRLMAKLSHRNIMPILADYTSDDPPSFVMPLAEMDLEEYFSNCAEMRIRLGVFREIASGLSYAHQQNVLHRDLKPHNILIFSDRETYPVISDFGIGRDMQSETTRLTTSGAQLGTYVWAAPEQYSSPDTADHRTDIYSLGRILEYAATGSVPGSAIEYERIPKGYRFIVEKACRTDLDQRYQSVDELLKDLDVIENSDFEMTRPDKILDALESLIGSREENKINDLLNRLLTTDDGTLREVFPKVPLQLLEMMYGVDPVKFKAALEAYDSAVKGSLEFKYCDVAARFYCDLFFMTEDPDIRKIIVARLPLMAVVNNRFQVRKVFGQLLESVWDNELVLFIREKLLDNPDAAKWCNVEINSSKIHPQIASVLPGGEEYIEPDKPEWPF